MLTARYISVTLVFFRFFVCLAMVATANKSVAEAPTTAFSSGVVSLDGPDWLLAPDPENVGRDQRWWQQPTPDAKPTKVPWVIQDIFPDKHGVFWYWRDFEPPANPYPEGRYVLRLWNVDYRADVWLNETYLGSHEGNEGMFTFDATSAIKPKETNRLAVRVLNPTNTQRIDDIVLAETTHRAKADKPIPFLGGGEFNHGGIEDSVELLMLPAVYVADMAVQPDWKTGRIDVEIAVCNTQPIQVQTNLELAVGPASQGETLAKTASIHQLSPGECRIRSTIIVDKPHLWDLNDPYLYRVTARLGKTESPGTLSEHSTRCGFRDFRFENGFFRLNGRRIYLRSSHIGGDSPIGLQMPHDPDIARRILLDMKVMGFNAIRFFCALPRRYQLDLCDEIGLLAWEGTYGSWPTFDSGPSTPESPKRAERFQRSITDMIMRDRNHPSLVIWELLNETHNGPAFRQAVDMLPHVRSLDPTRLVVLNCGRFDGQEQVQPADKRIGSISNPGSTVWESVLSDQHHYPPTWAIHDLRGLRVDGMPVFVSEFGIGSAIDLVRTTRFYEQLGATHALDARAYRARLDLFMADWQRWRMDECFADPQTYFTQCLARMADYVPAVMNAVRSNPNIISYSMSSTVDQGLGGEGVVTTFRDFKPGVVDALYEGWSPLRWCLFAEPVQVFRGGKVKIEAVLANEDSLRLGQYPVRLQIVAPNGKRVFDRTVEISIPDPKSTPEPAFAMPVFAEEMPIDGPSGKYRFIATFQQGAAATGNETVFYVTDRAEMPKVETEVVLWGEDLDLSAWLSNNGIHARPFISGPQTTREVILVGSRPAPGEGKAFADLARHIARGSHAVFLCIDAFKKDNNSTFWLPMASKGGRHDLPMGLYRKDDWAKQHPIFDGLPSGGVLDYPFYRDILRPSAVGGQDAPAEAVAGAINNSYGYGSGLTIGVWRLGAGSFTLNTLQIREILGSNPVAERLLRNMLRHAAHNVTNPPVDLPTDFELQLKTFGY